MRGPCRRYTSHESVRDVPDLFILMPHLQETKYGNGRIRRLSIWWCHEGWLVAVLLTQLKSGAGLGSARSAENLNIFEVAR
jgi:hypothetical protein